jgi:hypothetical protein
MPHLSSNAIKALTAALSLLLATVALAACGSSKGSSSSSTSPGTPNAAAGAPGSRFTALRECLQKAGITLPKRTPGQRRPPGVGGFLGGVPGAGGGPQLPKGVTREQYETALRKCGGNLVGRGNRFNSTGLKQAFAKFSACMHQNGISLPKANTSGHGPVFNTAHLNTASAQFKTAEAKCGALLRVALPGGPARSGTGAAAGGPS